MKAVRRCVRRMSLRNSAKIHPASKEELIEENVQMLSGILEKIVASRGATADFGDDYARIAVLEQELLESNTLIVHEVSDEIDLLPPKGVEHENDPSENESASFDAAVAQQLREYITSVSDMYPDHHFHSFEHACNVARNIPKMFARMFPPSDARGGDHTLGLTNNSLIEFASVFSALIHDVDHAGVPNTQLVKEHAALADQYHNQSVAEQNSLALAWALLMQDRFEQMRRTIYRNETEFRLFRQLVVNMVMATDISDRDINAQRKARYEELFRNGTSATTGTVVDDHHLINRKATVVLELLMQSADIIHTMQEWDMYKEWNEKFFKECCRAWRYHRADQEPSETWYQGEIGFFDFYIIPLATKLKDVGVFGEFGNEYLHFAKANRKTWEHRGKKIVAGYVKHLKAQGLWLCDEKDSDTANGSDTPSAT